VLCNLVIAPVSGPAIDPNLSGRDVVGVIAPRVVNIEFRPA
jgi:hypothetical protein